MPDDVAAALERFETFLGSFPIGATIDEKSGFTVADGMLLAGEVEISTAHTQSDENPII